MEIKSKIILVFVGVIALLSIAGVNTINAQTDVTIPAWVKGVANFWVEDKINDAEYAEALEFLIDSGAIQLGNTVIVEKSVSVEEAFGIEKDTRTLETKYNALEEASKLRDQQYIDDVRHSEKLQQNITDENDKLQNEVIENHRISEEEKAKLTLKVRELEQEIFQFKFDTAQKVDSEKEVIRLQNEYEVLSKEMYKLRDENRYLKLYLCPDQKPIQNSTK